ncbi:uncharacterized protein LOC143917429 [Arctopsyche grandis]|uniref:uncharacterized protein LOC143917429 n=1 Tax=Arctopsyche grandis TaxID=121162 RepID=UPI00406D7E20
MDERQETPIVLQDDIIEIINRISTSENIEDAKLDISEATDKGDNYMGNLYRVKASDKYGKSISVIVKCSPVFKASSETFPIGSLYEREIFTYSEVLPALDALQDDFEIPKKDRFYHAKYYGSSDEAEKKCIFISDLAVEGYKMYIRQTPFDKQHLELVIKTMAHLHATSFVIKKTNPELFEKLTQEISKPFIFEAGDAMIEMGKNKCTRVIEDSEIRKRVEDACNNTVQMYKKFINPERTAPYKVICHGDSWINNFMFKYEEITRTYSPVNLDIQGYINSQQTETIVITMSFVTFQDDKVMDLRFIDWQVTRFASPITDIAYMMFMSTDEQIRSDYYTKSLDLYYEMLNKSLTMMGCELSECYPREVYEDQIKSTMPFGLISSMMLLPLILSEKDDVPDLDVIPGEYNLDTLDDLLSKSCRERINGIAKDFASYGLI